MSYKVPFIRPNFPSAAEMTEDYAKIVANNWYTNFGIFERQFAQEIGAYIGQGYYAATFSSATSGLIAAILGTLGKGNNSKFVLMPSFTFAAGADALIWCGYRPLFVDIETEGLHMDIVATRKILNDETYKSSIVGILFCNAFGVGTTNIEDWETVADQSNLPLIIDSAAGFGSLYTKTRKVGSAGDCEIFSFHATKPFAIGEGGAVVSRNQELIDSLNSIENFGFRDRNAVQLGFNGKLQEINAAIGLRQFKQFSEVLKSRQSVFARYKSELNPKRFRLQKNAENASLCFAAVALEKPTERDGCIADLKAAGVDAKIYYSPALHLQDYFLNTTIGDSLANTDLVDGAILSLPIHDNMASADIDLVIKTLNQKAA